MNARERREAQAVVEAAERTMSDIEDIVQKLERFAAAHLEARQSEVPGDQDG